MDPISIAWLAGILDGEGFIGIIKHSTGKRIFKNPTYTARISINMTDKDTIYRIKDLVTVGSLQIKKGTNKPVYSWVCTGTNKVLLFIHIVEPYVFTKKKELSLLKEFCIHKSETPRCGVRGLDENTVLYREKLHKDIKRYHARSEAKVKEKHLIGNRVDQILEVLA